ncbi:MAG: FecR family protein, partial [Parvibaculales bacterium]
MRRILSLIVFLAISNTAYGSKTVSGVVAVSTGPMQAYTQSIGRDLAAGDDVFLNDEVETGETTRAQVLLRDESVFSLAPSSKVLFDEFVYDPMAGEGVLEASLLSGGMRFVSGQLSKNQPENIKIKAGKATVGIRGTEIMAKHGEQGTTFVLLSGAMEIATESGRQLIDRSGFGIDISNDGMLGVVRQVPLAEINAILAPPPKKEESKSGDSEASSDENGEESAEAEEEGEDTASESEGESESEAEASADASSESEAESQETASSDTAPAQSDSAGDDDSSFDAALTSSVSSSEGETEVTVAGLSDIAAPSADNASTAVTA